VERLAVADRQALLTAAAVNGAQEYTPLDITERLDEWEAWLAHDPGDTQEARDERRIRELMGEVA
jgi:hypothetical protein